MKKSSLFLFLLVFLLAGSANAQPPSLQDPFLDNFVGDWKVARDMGKRGVYQTTVHCEWVLKHQFIEIHYGAADANPKYEAFVFFGFDTTAKSYVCHWVDVFGATDSELGWAKIEPPLLGTDAAANKIHALEFKFGNELTNKFTFDPQTKTWTSLIRQVEKGQWVTFAEEKWTKQ